MKRHAGSKRSENVPHQVYTLSCCLARPCDATAPGRPGMKVVQAGTVLYCIYIYIYIARLEKQKHALVSSQYRPYLALSDLVMLLARLLTGKIGLAGSPPCRSRPISSLYLDVLP